MTIREKRMAGLVGGGVLLLIGYQIINYAVVGPFRQVREDLANARAQKAQLARRKSAEEKSKKEWEACTARTLGVDAILTQQRFRDDVQRLINAHGLERDGRVANGSPSTAKNGFVTIPLTVNAKGSLSDVVGLLKDFYRRPYFGQITKLTLDAGEQMPKSKGKEKADEVAINMMVQTLMLPKMADIPSKPLVDPNQLTTQVDETRLAMKDLSEYDRIVGASIFRWPITKVVEVVATTTPKDDHKTTKPDKPPRPPPEDKHVLCGVVSLDGEQIAYIRDEGRRDQAPEEHKLNDTVDGGKIILIHPTGMVVRVEKSSGASNGDPKDFFYPLGKQFKDKEELTPDKFPEVAADLQIATGA